MTLSRKMLNSVALALLLTACVPMAYAAGDGDAKPSSGDNIKKLVEETNLPTLSHFVKVPSPKVVALSALFLSFGRLWSKHTKAKAPRDYSFQGLLDVTQVASEKYRNNVFAIWDQWFVGQPFKSAKLKPEGDAVVVGEGSEPYGVLGHFDTYVIHTGQKASQSLVGLLGLYTLLNNENEFSLHKLLHKLGSK